MDANTKAIAHVLRQWHEAPSAQVIPFPSASERMKRQGDKQQRPYARPRPPTGGNAA